MENQQHILKREHINSEFNNIFHYPLTLAVAAMGYGKTTSARDFLDDARTRYVWVSVESNESTPQYIWDSFTRQLSKAIPKLGNQLRILGFPADAPQRDKILSIIEDYTYLTNTILVIDDYHYSNSPEFDMLIRRIVRTKIDGLHILILSRTIPDINIEELKLKGYCYVINSDLFEVSQDEIKKFFKLYGYSITSETARQIYEISEGWVSAIYLIMQRFAEIGRLESGRSIERLIETSVMSRYTEKEVMILKSLCILDSFTPQQAVYVTDDIATERIIQRLSFGNSFIRFDEQEGVYRIHNIFNNYLKKLLEIHPSKIDLHNLYKRSGQWCIENGNTILGLQYLLKAKEYDLILLEFEKNRINVIIDNNPGFILEIFKHIPIDVKYHHPLGYLTYIGFYVTNVDQENGAQLLTEIEQYYQKDEGISDIMKKNISGEIELIRAYLGFNDASLMGEKLKKAHKILNGHSSIANKDKIITFGSPHSLYLYYREEGKLFWTMECVEEMFHHYTDMAGGCGKGFDDLLHSEYCLETGDIEGARLYALKAIYKAKSLKQVSVIICAKLTLARASIARGKFNETWEIIDDLREEVEGCNSPILSSAFDLCAGYIGGIMGNDTSFAKWIDSGDMEQSEVLYQGMGFNNIIYGKYLLVKEDYIKLEVLCEQLRQNLSFFNNMLGYLHTSILDASAKYKLYGMNAARAAILPALRIGRADAIVLPFAEYGVNILEILKDLRKNGENDEYLDKLVRFTSKYSANLKNIESVEPTISVLTSREKDILRLIVDGKINREIASELYIAEVTVRKNITSIYRKLDVTGRASAVKKTIELKII